MRAGYRYALRHRYDAAVQVDADGQHDPTYLKLLVRRPRVARTSWSARASPARATTAPADPAGWAMRLLAFTLTRLAGSKMTDVTSGFRAANRRAIRVFADHYPAEYLGDTVESLVIAIRAGCTVTQVPVSMRIRSGGRASQTPLKASVYLLRAVVALGLALVRKWPTTLENLSEEDL